MPNNSRAEKLEALKEKYGNLTEKINLEMPFGEWIDFWYQTYCGTAPR